MPILKREEQSRPTVTEAEFGGILANAQKRYRVVFALLAGIGLRVGETMALKPTDLSQDFRVLLVRRSIWHGQEQAHPTS
jgi:integrase